MDKNDALCHLLKTESEAAALVIDAQAEADRRVEEAEKQNRASFEEHYKKALTKLENEFCILKEQTRRLYLEELAAYKETISSVNTDTNTFSALFDELIAGEP